MNKVRRFTVAATLVSLTPFWLADDPDRVTNTVEVKTNAKVWTVVRPHAVKNSERTQETAEVRPDHSVQMSLPSPGGSLPELTFKFARLTTVRKVRLELLPDTRFADRRLGRIPNKKTMLFEVEARRVVAEGKSQRLEWDSCTSTSLADGEGWHLCDAASDTGWEVPPLSAAATSHELTFAFREPIVLPADGQLIVVLDSGWGDTGTLARFRFSFAE